MARKKQGITHNKQLKLKTATLLKRKPGGKLDIDSKAFMLDPSRFADAINYYIYDGKQVVNSEDLKPTDTTAIAFPYGDNAIEPIQKFRDVLKKWVVKTDGKGIYAIFGIENQSEVSYVMVVRNMLYDAIGYDEQIRNARKSYKKKKGLTNAERLSGFKKTDKLIPVITIVIYFGSKDWDAPRSLKEMLDVKDKRILQFVQNYELNLIEPSKLSDEQLGTFRTDLGLTLKFIKYSKDKKELDDLVSQDRRYRSLERDAFDLMNDITGSKIKPVMRGDKVDMCAAIEAMRMESKEAGRAEGITEGITVGTNDERHRVARDMLLEKDQPFPISVISKISKLSEDIVRGIAQTLKVDLA